MVVGQEKPLRYAITDLGAAGPATPLDAAESLWLRLRQDLARWGSEGIDFVQLREKHLDSGDLFHLAQQAMAQLAQGGARRLRLLVNGRPDVAIATRADGVHLTAHPGELTPAEVGAVFAAARLPKPFVSVSCHTLAEVSAAREHAADLILFGPVFEKRVHEKLVGEGTGLDQLQAACAAAGPVPVLALGGLTAANSSLCLQRGAVGIAGIRFFA